MRTVFKYPIPTALSKFAVILPQGFKFIRVMKQPQDGEKLMLWAEVESEAAKDTVQFQVFGTGHEIPAHGKWLATYDHGPFVFHLYQMSHYQ